MSQLQEDFIIELMNIAMGLAASSMSEMIDDEVQLSVPKVTFISRQEVIEQFSSQVNGNLAGVSQKVSGALDGELLLLFPSDKSLTVVEMMMQDTVSLEGLAGLEQEALCEIGNILLNAVISSLADNIDESFESSLPVYISGDCSNVIPGKASNDEIILFMQVDFCFANTSVDGFVIILLNIDSVDMLFKKIDIHIDKIKWITHPLFLIAPQWMIRFFDLHLNQVTSVLFF